LQSSSCGWRVGGVHECLVWVSRDCDLPRLRVPQVVYKVQHALVDGGGSLRRHAFGGMVVTKGDPPPGVVGFETVGEGAWELHVQLLGEPSLSAFGTRRRGSALATYLQGGKRSSHSLSKLSIFRSSISSFFAPPSRKSWISHGIIL